jgi:hypothetical protein
MIAKRKTGLQANRPRSKRIAGKAQMPEVLCSVITTIAVAFVFSGCGPSNWAPEYAIGATGPGGGIIFYINQEGFVNAYDNSTCHYLEVAPSHSGPFTWITQGYEYLTANSIMTNIVDELGGEAAEAIGMGRRNTQIILSHDPTAPAAYACVNLTAGGKSDWFLPSIRELGKLLGAGSRIGITDGPSYWSSSIYTYVEAQYMDFAASSGNYGAGDVNASYLVRPIRAF